MFKTFLVSVALASVATGAIAAEEPPALEVVEAQGHTLEEYHWVARPLVIFADSPLDPRFLEQMDLLAERPEALTERDVVVIVDTDPSANTAIRTELRPREFALVLIGKDGQKYLRKPFPWDVRELVRSIDKMPVRLQETQGSRTVR